MFAIVGVAAAVEGGSAFLAVRTVLCLRVVPFETLGLPLRIVLRVRIHDPTNKAVPHDVIAREPNEVDVVDFIEHAGD